MLLAVSYGHVSCRPCVLHTLIEAVDWFSREPATSCAMLLAVWAGTNTSFQSGHAAWGPATLAKPFSCVCCQPAVLTAHFVPAPPASVVSVSMQARRRLARQFRKHKLEPQTVSGVPSRAASEQYNSQLVRPRTRSQQQQGVQQQQQHTLQEPQQWQQQQLPPSFPPSAGAYGGQLHPADAAAAAAAAREMLEWQFRLEPEPGQGSSTAAAAADVSTDVSTSAWAESDSVLQLPSTLLPGLSTAAAGADAGKQLTKAIMRAGHWRQVQSLIQEHAPGMVNTRHLCAALTRMVTLQPTFHKSSSSRGAGTRPIQQQGASAGLFLQQLYSSIQERLPEVQYRQSCNVLWAIGKLQHTALPSAILLQDFYQHARQVCATEQRQLEQQQQGEDCSAQAREQQLQWQAAAFSHAGQVASSLVALQEVLPAQQLQETVGWTLSTTRDCLQEQIQQHQPVQEQRAGSKTEQQQQQQRIRGLVKPCQRPLPARNIANLAASLATLGAQPSPAWLSAYAAALGCKGLVYISTYRCVVVVGSGGGGGGACVCVGGGGLLVDDAVGK